MISRYQLLVEDLCAEIDQLKRELDEAQKEADEYRSKYDQLLDSSIRTSQQVSVGMVALALKDKSWLPKPASQPA